MAAALNKITLQWADATDAAVIANPADWILNPQFDDEPRAMALGSNFWIIGQDNTISVLSDAELAAIELARRKEAKWKEIQAERDRRKYAGVYVASVDKWFHTDDSSRIQQLGLVMMGAGLPAGIMWKTLDNSFIPMTRTLAMQIFQGIAANDVAIFAVAEQHKLQVFASNDPINYNFLTMTPKWPKIYGE